jgi:hypothetical protein
MVRIALALLALTSCAPQRADTPPGQREAKEQPECCAIAPRAKCASELLRAGVAKEEIQILMGPPERICPTDRITDARLRYVASLQGPECKAALGYDALAALNAGKCSKAIKSKERNSP